MVRVKAVLTYVPKTELVFAQYVLLQALTLENELM